MQAWIAGSHSTRNPYRLFAVSNLASLAALLAYPWLIEPWLRTAAQAVAWSAAYAAYAMLLRAISLLRPAASSSPSGAIAHADVTRTASRQGGAPGWRRTLAWLALAALGSYQLLAVTNHLTQNIPSFPMMWVLPLVIYLLSFTLCFDADRWYSPRVYRVATLIAVLAMCALLVGERQVKAIGWHIGTFLLGLFIACMFCHGELAHSRPAASRLTQFYLAVSAGGVFGGALVALVAPAILPGYFEVEIGLVLLAATVWWRSLGQGRVWALASALVLVCTLATAVLRVRETMGEVIHIGRNFFGVLRVREYGSVDEPEQHEHALIHGRVMHGEQFLAPHRRRQPTSYYTRPSGIGRLLTALDDRRLEVGAVGLGAGTIATYGKAEDRYRFYEIDEAMVAAAHRYFSFIADSPAQVEVKVGDGRLLLQAEAPQRFDVLVVDAFSGDSIPVHLLTREAVMLYRDRIKPGGVIALHISNSHMDLGPVVRRIAADLGLELAQVADDGVEGDVGSTVSDWILLSNDRAILDLPRIREATTLQPPLSPSRAWTDDYSNILQVLSFGRLIK